MSTNHPFETLKLSHKDVTLDYTLLRQFTDMAPCATKKHKEDQNIKKISVSVLIVSFTTILTPINRGGVFDGKSIVCHRGVSYP